jgi:hypothetical protein
MAREACAKITLKNPGVRSLFWTNGTMLLEESTRAVSFQTTSNQGQFFCPVPLHPLDIFPLDDLSVGKRDAGMTTTWTSKLRCSPWCRAAVYHFPSLFLTAAE